MRIALLSQPRDPIAARGAQRGSVAIVLSALASRLAARHAVLVLAPRRRREPAEETGPGGFRLVRARPPLAALHRLVEGLGDLLPGRHPHLARAWYFEGYAARLAARLRASPPDLLHVMTLAQALPALARRLPGVPLVLHLHDEMLLGLDRERASGRLAAAAAIVTVSAWLAGRLAERFPEHARRIVPIGNGVDLERFAPAAGQRPRAGEERLLFVGRISPEKGVHVLLEAFALLAPRRPGLRLELVGEPGLMPRAVLELLEPSPALRAALAFYGHGPLARLRRLRAGGRGYLEACLGRLAPGLRARVEIRGAVPHDRLVERYRAADLLIAPSVCNEPFCLPVAEAMASGLACVASRAGAPPELIGAGREGTGEAGLAVPPGEPAALARAIEALLDDPGRRRAMGLAGRARAERLLGWDAAVDRLEAVYRALASGRAG